MVVHGGTLVDIAFPRFPHYQHTPQGGRLAAYAGWNLERIVAKHRAGAYQEDGGDCLEIKSVLFGGMFLKFRSQGLANVKLYVVETKWGRT